MRYGILIILCFSFTKMNAQSTDRYTFRHIGQADGLLHDNVFGIQQDARGFMWIITPNGLQRYDGSRFKNFTGIVNDAANGMSNGAELSTDNKKNEVWVSKINLIEKLELATNRTTGYTAAQVLNNRAFKFDTYTDESNHYYHLGEKGIFYSGTDSNKIITSFLNIHPPYQHVGNAMARDSLRNETWLIGEKGLLLFDGNTKQVFTKKNNSINHPLLRLFGAREVNPKMLMIDSRYDCWISTWGNTFYRFNQKSGKLIVYNLSSLKSGTHNTVTDGSTLLISTIYEDNHANIWVATENAGLLLYNKAADNFEEIKVDGNSSQSIKYNFKIYSVTQDKEENIWLGTDKGISIFNPYRHYFKAIQHDEKMPSLPKKEIMSIIQTKTGDILVGTWGGGIAVYDGQWKFKKNILFPGPYQYNMVWCFIQQDNKTDTDKVIASAGFPIDTVSDRTALSDAARYGDIWVGCQHGYILIYNHFTQGFRKIRPPELEGSTIHCMTKDDKGNIWFGLHNGKIAQWNKQQNRFYPYNSNAQNDLNNGAPVFKILIDKTRRYWVSSENGFKQFDPEKRTYSRIFLPQKNNPHTISAVSSLGIEAINDSTLLIGTVYGGLNYFNTVTGNFSHPFSGNGLSSATIHALKKDNMGYTWFTTDYNLYKFKPGTVQFTRYNVEQGTINSSFNAIEFYMLQNGTWLTASTTEIICFDPTINFPKNNSSKVEITGFKIFDSTIFIDSLLYQKKPVQLSHKQNFLTIEFALLNFSNLQQTSYYYKLSEVNNDWVNAGSKNFASYTNLTPGNYTFSVKTENDTGVPIITFFNIVISPPFWQTWWFKSVIAFFMLLLLTLLIRWREKNIKLIAAQKLKVQQLSAAQYKSKLELEQIVNYFSTSLIDKKTVDDVLWDVAKNLIGRLGFVDCMIYQWNADKTRMIQKAGFGPKGSIEEINKQPFDVLPGQGVVGYVMQTKEPLLISDTSTDDRYRQDEMKRLSEIAVPVIYNNELTGVIDSEHPEKNFYTASHLQILNTIATLMANKIKSLESEQLLQHTYIEMYSINEQLLKAKLEALRAQMNPHFIFNCLTSIDNLIQMDEKEKATLYLSKFAKLIRSILENATNNTVPCWKDIETLKLYLELEELRWDKKFSYQVIVADEIINGDYKVPPLIIQPFVENAIHHGLLNKIEGDKKLLIRVSVAKNLIQYLIEDNGVGRVKANEYKQLNKSSHQSLGMQITTDRINLFNRHNEGFVKITDLVNELMQPCGTRVTIELINQS